MQMPTTSQPGRPYIVVSSDSHAGARWADYRPYVDTDALDAFDQWLELMTSQEMLVGGTRVVTGSQDNSAKLWDAATGKDLRRLGGHADRVPAAAFSPDGKAVLTGSWDRTARVWPVPVPPPDDLERIMTWVETMTGLRFVEGSLPALVLGNIGDPRCVARTLRGVLSQPVAHP